MNVRETVLVSGFEGFGEHCVNPSEQLANKLQGASIDDASVESVVLPVTFEDAFTVLASAIERVRPQFVFCLGQAGGSDAICVERIAVNICDAAIADNAGHMPRDIPIEVGGPVAYWSTLPVTPIVVALSGAGLAVKVSYSAGTFVCNHVFYKLMRNLSQNPQTLGGFVHVPYLPEQALQEGCASMSLEEMERGLRLAIGATLVEHRARELGGR